MTNHQLENIGGTEFSERATHYDLVVVGAGIVGLGHAYEARQRGLSVAVVDRAATIAGSSVRNFGHIGGTAQSGAALEYAILARASWKRLAVQADFWLSEAGAVIAARSDDEYGVLEEFHAERGNGSAVLLSARKVADCTPIAEETIVGGAWLSHDLQVDPRTAAPRIAAWLADGGVDFFWLTNVVAVTDGVVHTARGDLAASAIVVAVNYDVDWLYPEIAASAGLERCSLEMLSARAVLARDLAMPVLTGWSMIRYSGFSSLASTAAVRERLHSERPDLAALDVNQMYTQRPNGDLLVGDTHTVSSTVSPFQREDAFDRLLEITRDLFGVDELVVRERWQGVYAKAREEFLVYAPSSNVKVVSVTTGIGMTTGLGLAASVMQEMYGHIAERSIA
jgi:FAD dependent oxidoreductase TIGR03364